MNVFLYFKQPFTNLSFKSTQPEVSVITYEGARPKAKQSWKPVSDRKWIRKLDAGIGFYDSRRMEKCLWL
jgi:hypothetical protein